MTYPMVRSKYQQAGSSTAVYERQALVLVNADGQATGQDIARLAEYVQEQVAERFGLQISPEVRYISRDRRLSSSLSSTNYFALPRLLEEHIALATW